VTRADVVRVATGGRERAGLLPLARGAEELDRVMTGLRLEVAAAARERVRAHERVGGERLAEDHPWRPRLSELEQLARLFRH
jgi:hypothetical protein